MIHAIRQSCGHKKKIIYIIKCYKTISNVLGSSYFSVKVMEMLTVVSQIETGGPVKYENWPDSFKARVG